MSAYAPIGAGIPGHKLNLSIGIMKAYSSCVGEGPFTTELAMTEAEKDVLREHGHEYGAATGRPRRVGPFDAVASRYGVQCQGCDELALTLLDVLDYMEEVPIVTAYKLTDGSTTTRFPMGKTLDDAQPVVETVPAGTATSPACAGLRTCPSCSELCHTSGGAGRLQDQVYLRRPRSAMPASCGSNFSPWPPPRGGKNL